MSRLLAFSGRRAGQADAVDTATVVVVSVMVLIGSFAIFRFFESLRPPLDDSVAAGYGHLLNQLNADCRHARSIEVTPAGDGIDVLAMSGARVEYRLADATLRRNVQGAQASGAIELMTGLEHGRFVLARPRLLQVVLVPRDVAQMPFFTSIALRGLLTP